MMRSLVFYAANRVQTSLGRSCCQLRSFRTDARSPSSPGRRRPKFTPASSLLKKRIEEKSEWWAVDGEMHEIGENVPPRERFVIPRENIPNRRRKQLRDQYMRRTRLIMKENEHEGWCKRYMELYNEMRENWERLYWDEGYSKKLAQDHANHDTSEDDDEDFNPNPRRPYSFGNQMQGQGFGRQQQDGNNWRNDRQMRDRYQGFSRQQQEGNSWQNVSQIRDKFEYDREKRMREKAFAPMSSGGNNDFNARGGRDFDFNTRGGRDNDFNARGGRDMSFNPRGGRDMGFNTSVDARPYDFDSGSE